MVKAVCFDFDGVIISSSELQKQALQYSYQMIVGDENYPSYEEFFSHSGDSLENIFKQMGLPQEMVKPYRQYSVEHMNKVTLHTGIKRLLRRLKYRKIKCGLCTGKDKARTLMLLESCGILEYFDYIVCSDEVKRPKPHPESLNKLLDQMKINKENAVMIGDAANDIKCAKQAGVKSIGVSWGDGDVRQLEQFEADYIVDTVEQLEDSIDEALFGIKRKKYLVNDFVMAEEFCNMNCQYCLTATSEFKDNLEEKSVKYCYKQGNKFRENLNNIAQKALSTVNAPILKLSGGEILLIENIEEFIIEQAKLYKVVQVLTNGVNLNERLLRKFQEAGNICLQISLDHHTMDGNAYRTRHQKVLDRILKNIDLAAQIGIPVEINCVLTDKNTMILQEFAEYLLKYGDSVVLFPFPIRGKESGKFYPNSTQLNGLKRLIDNYSRYEKVIVSKTYLEYLYEFLTKGKRQVRCSLPGMAVGVFDDGIVTPCPNYWFISLGNLNTDFTQISKRLDTDKIYSVLMHKYCMVTECQQCFTPWEMLNLYVEDKISLDEVCKSPVFNYPELKEEVRQIPIKLEEVFSRRMKEA